MRKQGGFTLIELIVTMTVAGILAAVAVPSFKTNIENNRLVTQSNDLLSALLYARTEAINQGATQNTLNHLTTIVPVQVCASSDGQTCNSTNWANGWIVYGYTSSPSGTTNLGSSHAFMLRSYPALPNGTTLNGTNISNNGIVAFNSSGMPTFTGTQTIPYFILCDSRGVKYSRAIYLGASGEARVGTTPGYQLNGTTALTSC